LEHIKSEELINRLDKFLNYPKYDPHGDPIPDQQGNIRQVEQKTLAAAKVGDVKKVVGVKDSSAKFLQYLDSVKISLGTELEVLQILDFDNSLVLKLKNKTKIGVSQQVVKNLLVV
jgi:DtxR family Mn-dependent transcriptional regulator